MTEDEKDKKIKELEEKVKTFEFFSNPINTGVTTFNGIKIILQKIEKIEKKLGIEDETKDISN